MSVLPPSLSPRLIPDAPCWDLASVVRYTNLVVVFILSSRTLVSPFILWCACVHLSLWLSLLILFVVRVKKTQDALDRARIGDDEIARTAASRMSLMVADSTEVLEKIGLPSVDSLGGRKPGAVFSARPDVVYLDPMFSQRKGGKRKKSALVKKGMQMLQALLEVVEKDEEGETENDEESGPDRQDQGLVGASRDVGFEEGHVDVVGGAGSSREGVRAEEERKLFNIAMSVATRKVVVKRPVHGETIVRHVKPSHAVVSKNGRFDVYVVPP